MTRPQFSVHIEDLERGEKRVSWTIGSDWLQRALVDADAAPTGPDGSFDAELRKEGADILVRGRIRVDVTLTCSRTLDPAPYSLEPEILLLLSPASGPDGGASAAASARPSKRRGKRKQRDSEYLSDSEAARDTYAGDTIVLDEFVREFIVLEFPMVPLRADLRSEDAAAMPPLPASAASDPKVDGDTPLDPRLAPLAAIASRLREKKKE